MSHYRMIDVGSKTITDRQATAYGSIQVSSEIAQHIHQETIPKGNPLVLAEIAGIQAAKLTSTVLPLCHPLIIDKINVACHLNLEKCQVECLATVRVHGKTGVEMEAITSVQTALGCIYDLCKMIDSNMIIGDVMLLQKTGGKQGLWRHKQHTLPKWADHRFDLRQDPVVV